MQLSSNPKISCNNGNIGENTIDCAITLTSARDGESYLPAVLGQGSNILM